MASFDFTALINFLATLFEAFAALAEKLGFDFDNLFTNNEPTTEETAA